MNELAISNDWGVMKEQASYLVSSGFLPPSVNTAEKAIAIILTSKELGIGAMEGFRSINVIQGKPTISPQLMLALALRTGQMDNYKIDANDERCIVTVIRKGRDPHTEEFGVKQAQGLGLLGRDNYNKQRATMFKWRALAANLRVTFPDVMLGFYTPEEMGAQVKVTDNEEMEIVAEDLMVNTGVRVPKGYKDMSPEERRERIGEGNEVRPTEKGLFIFTPKQAVDEFKTDLNSWGNVQFITKDEQKELFKMIKAYGISEDEFKGILEEKFGVKKTSEIKADDYLNVVNSIILNGKPQEK